MGEREENEGLPGVVPEYLPHPFRTRVATLRHVPDRTGHDVDLSSPDLHLDAGGWLSALSEPVLGVPLELAVIGISGDWPRRVGRVADRDSAVIEFICE